MSAARCTMLLKRLADALDQTGVWPEAAWQSAMGLLQEIREAADHCNSDRSKTEFEELLKRLNELSEELGGFKRTNFDNVQRAAARENVSACIRIVHNPSAAENDANQSETPFEIFGDLRIVGWW